MNFTVYPNLSIELTGQKMAEVVELYNEDVAFLDDESLLYCFDYVARLPYLADPKDGEYISRPQASLSPSARFRDCDDKAIILGCCLYRRDIDFYFVAVSEEPDCDFHHVLIEIARPEKDFVNGKLQKIKFLDCTYPENEFGLHNKFFKKKRI